MNIHRPSLPLFFTHIDSTGALMANPGPWPTAHRTFASHFYRICDPELYDRLVQFVDLSTVDHFQSNLMLYDTVIIHNDTLRELVAMMRTFGKISHSDQAIFNVYFSTIRKVYRFLPYRLPQTLEVRRQDECMSAWTKREFVSFLLDCSLFDLFLSSVRFLMIGQRDSPEQNILSRHGGLIDSVVVCSPCVSHKQSAGWLAACSSPAASFCDQDSLSPTFSTLLFFYLPVLIFRHSAARLDPQQRANSPYRSLFLRFT